MVIDILLKLFKKDPLIKRNIVKTVSWRIAGSIDTMLLGWLITGYLSVGAKIGLTELLTKMLLYYFHERIWQGIKFGLPTKKQQTQRIQDEIKPNLFKQSGRVTRKDREHLNRSRSFTIWLTGLSGSGKSTLASEIEAWLHRQHYRVYILDGDNTRLGINNDLSFSDEDRTENIRRVAEICKLFNDAGVIVIASFISPFIIDRKMAENLIGKENFIEIFIDASLGTCQNRDPKGLYKLALTGKIKNFTGVSSPYEAPLDPDLRVDTNKASVTECMNEIVSYLEKSQKVGIHVSSVIQDVS